MTRPHPLRALRTWLGSGTWREPRLALLLVPVVGLVLLMTADNSATPIPIVKADPTTTSAPDSPDVSVLAETVASDTIPIDGHAAGGGRSASDDDYDPSLSSGSGNSSSSRRSSSSGGSSSGSSGGAAVAGVTTLAPTTTVPTQLPTAVVSEAGSPAVLGLVAVGVSALVVNGVVLARRRRANRGEP